MSLKYRDSAGTETPVAGLNGTSGELVPSVALQQSGTVNISMPNTSALTDLFIATVTFDTPFDDTDYVLNVDQCEVSEAEINRVYNKTTTGFTVAVMYNRKLTAVPSYNVGARIPWSAFKLMTDTVHEAASAHIAQNTANFASAFSDTVSYAVGDYVTYNNVLYRCTTAHTAGVWVAGHFTQITVGSDLATLSSQVGTFTGYLASGATMTVTLLSGYAGFYGMIQVQGSGCFSFQVRNAAPGSASAVDVVESVTINDTIYRISVPHGIDAEAYDLRDKIRFQCTAAGVIQITNLGTETETVWLGGMIRNVTIS